MDLMHRLTGNITSIRQLKQYYPISRQAEEKLKAVVKRHPMSISGYYASLIDWNNPGDPLLQMAVPSEHELDLGGSYDTSGEAEDTKEPGLQHKYDQTALILATNRCVLYCRYCFRKRLVGISTGEILHRFKKAVDYIKEHGEINNVLLSGGDSLMLDNAVIEKFLEKILQIKHIDFVRLGTKIPVVWPQRITEDKSLHRTFKRYSKNNRRIYVVTQYNHPREISSESIKAVSCLLNSGVILINQTVLLKGVNDNSEVLADLQRKLTQIGINPYYVFQCRPVKRVKRHFQVPLYKGYRIVEKARSLLNGPSKRFRFVMSHKTGKIEVVGLTKKHIYLKYHQAKKNKNLGKFFRKRINKAAGWLEDLN